MKRFALMFISLTSLGTFGLGGLLATESLLIGPCWVVEVKDGDSIIVRLPDETVASVRYMGIDAPEEGRPLFQTAWDRNRGLVEGREVWLEVNPTEDGFLEDRDGRLLAYVFTDEPQTAPVQLTLVREGLALLDLRDVVERELKSDSFLVCYADELLEAQVEAARAELGLWGLPEFCSNQDFLIAAIRFWGDVEEVYLINRGEIAVELGDDWILMDESAHEKWEQGKRGRNVIAFKEALGPSCHLLPGGVLVVRTGPGIPKPERKTRQGCGTSRVILNWFGYRMWNADGDVAYLYAPDGALVCTFRYPWQERSS